ncbi:MAG: hypothetical protein Q8P67_09190, partial [archaeon]|nr:hypothetical protein [archaeon]
ALVVLGDRVSTLELQLSQSTAQLRSSQQQSRDFLERISELSLALEIARSAQPSPPTLSSSSASSPSSLRPPFWFWISLLGIATALAWKIVSSYPPS